MVELLFLMSRQRQNPIRPIGQPTNPPLTIELKRLAKKNKEEEEAHRLQHQFGFP